MQTSKARLGFVILSAVGLLLSGCATTKTVERKVAEEAQRTDKKLETIEAQLEDMQEKQKSTEGRVEEQGKQIEQLGQSASDALARAQEAGVLAKGKIVFQQSFAEDRVRFKLNSYDLTKEARSALDEFGARVKTLDKGVYLEIQGHTDDSGGTEYNDHLGQERAEAVRRYLSKQHQLPLGRMSTISYGETLPVAPNRTSKGRSQNRRVVIVVLE
jgi:peptidoglycan-associated lipoprotein